MSEEGGGPDLTRLLTGAIVVLVAFAVGMFAAGEYLVAGVTFLTITFAIYLRETGL